jgi:outer membrane beta-barrel protein
MMRTRHIPLLVLLALPVMLPETAARAERRNPLDGQPAVRHRFLMRKLRFEITPQFITSINQDYKHAFGPGGNLQFHLFDWLAVGVQGAYLFNANTGLEGKVRDALRPIGEYNTYSGPQPSLKIHDEHVMGINAVMSAYAQITPFYGKIAFFSALFVSYDLYVNGGVGFVNYTSKCCSTVNVAGKPNYDAAASDPNTQNGHYDGFKIGGQIGVGAHIYFNEWLGMQFELRDYIVGANPGGLDVNGDRKLDSGDIGAQNNIFFGVGFTIMMPPSARISR